MSTRPARLRFPPYADQVPAASERTVWVSAGPDAWERAKRWRRHGRPGLCCDPKAPPGHYDWRLVEGRNVALIALGLDREPLLTLIAELIDAGVEVIAILHGTAEADRMEIVVSGRDG